MQVPVPALALGGCWWRGRGGGRGRSTGVGDRRVGDYIRREGGEWFGVLVGGRD